MLDLKILDSDESERKKSKTKDNGDDMLGHIMMQLARLETTPSYEYKADLHPHGMMRFTAAFKEDKTWDKGIDEIVEAYKIAEHTGTEGWLDTAAAEWAARPENRKGTLSITVKGAKGLADLDAGFSSKDKSDPYAVINFAHRGEQSTKVIKNNLDPAWDESFAIPNKGGSPTWSLEQVLRGILEIEIRDRDDLTADDVIGEANEQMDELKENDSYDWEVNLDTQGSVSFSATFKEDKIPDVTAAYRAAISAFAK